MKVIFLDRDGTINVDYDYVHKKKDLKWEKNVISGLKLLSQSGFEFIIITNQSGIARGYFSQEDFWEFNDFLVEELKKENIIIKKTYFCPYHPTEGLGKYRLDSPLRKPGTGMLEAAFFDFEIDKEKSFLIGDKESDILAGKNFGITSVLIAKDGKTDRRSDFVARDFLEAAKFIIDNSK